ncbi:MAG: helix-turn-helix transcriptional regulator [Candidatus Riflebacteria bacterium]|nr:helix-turn-helix transcriptional regulator [Candidatus Riflebacteria bacterium]
MKKKIETDELPSSLHKDDGSEKTIGIGKRICEIRMGLNLSQVEFCAKLGIHQNTLSRYENTERSPDAEIAARICEAYGISFEWLLTGRGFMKNNELSENVFPSKPSIQKPKDVFDISESETKTFISLYEMQASAGHGCFLDSEPPIIATFVFPLSFFKKILNANPKNCFLLSVRGDSMKPTISDCDFIMVDKDRATYKGDGIYFFRYDGTLYVKRLQFLPKGHIKVISDNSTYEAFQINPPNQEDVAFDFTIFGKVIWHGRQML